MRDFETGLEFLFISQASSDMINMLTAPPDPKTVKRKALLCIKARQELDEEDPDNLFPTGIENEVVFMEVTGKTLGMLYSSCQVSSIPRRPVGHSGTVIADFQAFNDHLVGPGHLNFSNHLAFWRFMRWNSDLINWDFSGPFRA